MATAAAQFRLLQGSLRRGVVDPRHPSWDWHALWTRTDVVATLGAAAAAAFADATAATGQRVRPYPASAPAGRIDAVGAFLDAGLGACTCRDEAVVRAVLDACRPVVRVGWLDPSVGRDYLMAGVEVLETVLHRVGMPDFAGDRHPSRACAASPSDGRRRARSRTLAADPLLCRILMDYLDVRVGRVVAGRAVDDGHYGVWLLACHTPR